MGNRFDFAKIEVQRFFEQGFAVAGNAGLGDEGALRKAGVDVGDNLFSSCQRTSFIILIVRIEDFHVFAQDDGFDGGRTGVDAEIAGAAVAVHIAVRNGMLTMAFLEFVEFSLAVKEGGDPV